MDGRKNEAAETDREFNLSELEEIMFHLKDTAPGVDTLCYSMINNTSLSARYLILRLINQSFTEGRLPAVWNVAMISQFLKRT